MQTIGLRLSAWSQWSPTSGGGSMYPYVRYCIVTADTRFTDCCVETGELQWPRWSVHERCLPTTLLHSANLSVATQRRATPAHRICKLALDNLSLRDRPACATIASWSPGAQAIAPSRGFWRTESLARPSSSLSIRCLKCHQENLGRTVAAPFAVTQGERPAACGYATTFSWLDRNAWIV